MAIASRTDTTQLATITQQNLYDAIKASFVNCGFTAPHDQYTSGSDKIVVYAIVLDGSKTYGTTYLRIRVTTTLVINQQVYGTWAIGTHTGTGNSTEVAYTALVTNAQVNFTALNGGDEYKLSLLNQGTNLIILGFISPTNKPTWWDLNAWNFAFMPTTATFSIFRSTTFNPYGNTENDSILNTVRMGVANSITNRRDMLPGIIFFNQSNRGIVGRSSDDLVMVAASGTTIYDLLQIPNDTKQYLILNPAFGGLAARVS